MRNIKAKNLRRQAESMSAGQPNKFLIGSHRGKLEHAHSSTRAVYQWLKRSS